MEQELEQLAGARVVEQALQVLFAIAQGDQPQGVRGFAEHLGISKSTLQRILGTLQKSGLVRLDPVKQTYAFTSKSLILSASYQRDLDLVSMLRPSMEAMRKLSGETITLSLAVDGYRVTIFQLDSAHDLRLTTKLGKRYPLVVGATGRALLGSMTEVDRRDAISLYAETGVELATGEIIHIDPEEVDRRAREAHDLGYAASYGEWSPGGVGLSIPIPFSAPGGEVAALSIYGVQTRLSRERAEELIPELKRVSTSLAKAAADVREATA